MPLYSSTPWGSPLSWLSPEEVDDDEDGGELDIPSGEVFCDVCEMTVPSAATRNGLAIQSSSVSSNGFWEIAIDTSCCSSSVDSCSSRMDCCSCGVSARCCDRRSWRLAFMAMCDSL